MRIVRSLVILAALQAAGAIIAAPARAQDDRDDRSEARATSKLDTTVTISKDGTVDLRLVSGEIIVNAGSGNQVRVHAWSERGVLEFSSTGSRVSLDVHSQRGRMGDTRYEVTVPVGVRLELKSVSGDITTHGVAGELEAGAVSGDIDVSDATGRVEIANVSGDVKGDRLSGEVRVDVVSGDVTLSNVTGTLEVETVSGEMSIESSKLASLRSETVSGELTYDGTLDSSGRYEFHSQSGDIRLRIPASAGGSVRVETFSGSVDSDFPMTMQPGDHGTGEHPKRLEFTFGKGGSRITAETFSGDINIEKAGTP
jgi:Putative adhesin